MQKQSSSHAPVHVTVYDAVGIGAGGSGAAAGLLHPFAPTGKVSMRRLLGSRFSSWCLLVSCPSSAAAAGFCCPRRCQAAACLKLGVHPLATEDNCPAHPG